MSSHLSSSCLCEEEDTSTICTTKSVEECEETAALDQLAKLSASKLTCWDMWHVQGWSVHQIASAKAVKLSTVRGMCVFKNKESSIL
jgi:uncharacterized protein YpbB